jgi:hypothetical protein
MVAFYTSRDPAVSDPLVRAARSAGRHAGFAAAFERHAAAWDELWQDAQVGTSGLRRGHRRSAGATPAWVAAAGFAGDDRRTPRDPRTVHDLARQDAGQALAGNGPMQVPALCERLSLIGPVPQEIAAGSRSISRSKSPMPITARTGHRSKNPGDGRASPGIWPVSQPAADDGGITGPVPAQTCGQAAVTLTWMPPSGPGGRQPAGTMPSNGLAQTAGRVGRASRRARGTDPPTDSTVQCGPCPSGRVGQTHADRVGQHVGTSAGSAADTHSCVK